MKIEKRPWMPQDLLYDLQSIIDEEPDCYLNTRRSTLCMARDYLKELFSSPPNAPLTPDELRDMDGEPVWCDKFGWRICYGVTDFRGYQCMETGAGSCIRMDDYGKTWLAYRRKQEEETK